MATIISIWQCEDKLALACSNFSALNNIQNAMGLVIKSRDCIISLSIFNHFCSPNARSLHALDRATLLEAVFAYIPSVLFFTFRSEFRVRLRQL
jgi:hypothetical protein